MAKRTRLDLYKLYAGEYVTPSTPVLLKLKPGRYLAITGHGEPGGKEFQAKIAALYGAAYTLMFAQKAAGRPYGVCKLEGQWWGTGRNPLFHLEPKETWNWRLLIRTPEFVTAQDLRRAAAALLAKGKGPEVKEVKLETIREGRCVQMLHVGPYEREPETIEQMRAFAASHGLAFHGLHHEIYLSDPRRVAPGKLRTLLRLPAR